MMAGVTIQDSLSQVGLYIQNTTREKDQVFQPAVCEGIRWSTSRKGTPGKLTFKVLQDEILEFSEGNPVTLKVKGKDVFFGDVFTKQRDKNGTISVTAYDQMRYLKNKDVFRYENEKASEIIKKIVKDFKFKVGEITDTQYVIPKRRDSNSTLFDIIQTALDMTMQNTNEMYVLYDDVGKLTLKNVKDMTVNILIDGETAENYNYESSIDKETYTRVKLYFEDKQGGERKIFVIPKQDKDEAEEGEQKEEKYSPAQADWGILQRCESLNEKQTQNVEALANKLLDAYEKKTRRLSIQNAFGDVRVRAGSYIGVSLNLGDMIVNQYMLVESVDHDFKDNLHTMNLSLRGRDFLDV